MELPPDRSPPQAASSLPGSALSAPTPECDSGVSGASPAAVDGRLMVALLLALFVTGLDSSVVNVMLPKLKAVFATDMTRVTLVGTVYVATMAAFQLFFGRCADLFSPLRVFALGVLLFFLGSLGCAASVTIEHLLIGRILQGLGGATLAASFGAVILALVPKDKTGSVIGAAMTVMTIGALIGPPVGGYLAEVHSWHWAFLLNLPLCVLALACLAPLLRRERRAPTGSWRDIDLAGVVLSALVFMLLPAGLHLAGLHGWRSPLVWAALSVGGLCAWALARSDRRTEKPLLEFAPFREPATGSLLLVKVLLFVVLNGVLLVFPFFIAAQATLGVDDAGWLIACCALAMAVTTPPVGRAVDRFGGYNVMAAGALGFLLSALAGFTLAEEPSKPALAAVLAAFGVTLAALMVASTTAFLKLAPPGRAGVFSAVNSLASPVGAAIGFSLFSLLYGGEGLSGHDAAVRLHTCLTAMAILAAVMLALAQACRLWRPKAGTVIAQPSTQEISG